MREQGYAPVACLSIHSWRVAGVPRKNNGGPLYLLGNGAGTIAVLMLCSTPLQLIPTYSSQSSDFWQTLAGVGLSEVQ